MKLFRKFRDVETSPNLQVTWHHLRKFFIGQRLLIWAVVENVGGDAILYTDGCINEKLLGKGQYDLKQGEYVELGFYGNSGPIVTYDWLDGCDKIKYRATFKAQNGAGEYEVKFEFDIPVVKV